jgi:DNA-binding NarL/FixJ family response regulator
MVIDYQMPDQNGVDIATAARRSRPGLSVVILSEVGDNAAAMDAIDAGCSGFLTKDASAAEVAAAILATAAGDAHISSTLLLHLLKMKSEPQESSSALTRRELETLTHLVSGGTSKEIASRMAVSTSTIRNTVQSILTKLGAHSKLEAVTIAVRRGLVSYPGGASNAPIGVGSRRSNSPSAAVA